MSIPIRFPFAYKADVATARGYFEGRILVDIVDVDVPTMTSSDCPVVMTWRTDHNYRTPFNHIDKNEGELLSLRYRDGKFYAPVKSYPDVGQQLEVQHLPTRGIHDYGAQGSGALAHLYDRYALGGEERFLALAGWFDGKFRRQPVEGDILRRSKSDRAARREEAHDIARRLAVIDSVVHFEVAEPKFVVGTCHFNRRPDMPTDTRSAPLISIFYEEARFGARLTHFGRRTFDAKPESRAVSMRELDTLLDEYRAEQVPVLLDFDDLEVDDDLDFLFDAEANKRWRLIGDFVSRFSTDIQSMPDTEVLAWLRLRAVASLRENKVTHEALDAAYDDLIALWSTIDNKDRYRAQALALLEWWDEAPISIDATANTPPRL